MLVHHCFSKVKYDSYKIWPDFMNSDILLKTLFDYKLQTELVFNIKALHKPSK